MGVVATLAFGASDGEACSCAVQRPACEAYWTTDVVFRGRVEAVERTVEYANDPAKRVLVRFAVLEAFKGVDGNVVEVTTPTGRASCAYRFAKGREYVVYASRGSGTLSTNACSRTRPVGRAEEDLAFSRNIAAGGLPLGRISGRVRLHNRDLLTGRRNTRPMHDVDVTLTGERATVTLKTNRAGEFAVSGLDAGLYEVSVTLPGRFRVDTPPGSVELRDPRGCATVDVTAYSDGLVTGRVVDASGRPVRGLTLDLGARGADQHMAGADRLQTVTRDDGSFELQEVPAGHFVLGIDTRQDLAPSGGGVFYPGTRRSGEAHVVSVPAGGHVELPDFVIPDDVRFIEISGVVFDTEHVPVAGARVYLRGPAERDFILTAPVVTDLNGRFTIAALAGHEYRLFAERPRSDGSGRIDSSGLLPIVATPDRARLTLTLRSHH